MALDLGALQPKYRHTFKIQPQNLKATSPKADAEVLLSTYRVSCTVLLGKAPAQVKLELILPAKQGIPHGHRSVSDPCSHNRLTGRFP